MEIISWNFAAFTAIVLLIYYLLPPRAQNYWLLLASYSFYASWNLSFVAILAVTTMFNFLIGKHAAGRKGWMWIGIGVNLLALGIFRLVDSGYAERFLAYMAHANGSERLYLHILLPIGFSFYILQAISYLVDVYKKQLPPVGDIIDFSLYLAYFPKMLSGPIERARTFLPQLRKERIVDNQRISKAFILITAGLVRKILIVGMISKAIPLNLFLEPAKYTAPELMVYLVLYVFWLYNDFAGYTGIVRGISCLFGIDLVSNFEQPLFARNFVEFWNRWHISLSHWLRDYIFYPVSRSLLRLNRNQHNLVNIIVPPLATMLASGLWHNFGFYMLVWGGMHGVFQVIERLWLMWKPAPPPHEQPVWRQVLSSLVVFAFVALVFVSFGAGSFARALVYWQRMLLAWQKPTWNPIALLEPGAAVAACLLLDWAQFHGGDELVFLRKPRFIQAALLALVILVFLYQVVINENIVASFVYQGF